MAHDRFCEYIVNIPWMLCVRITGIVMSLPRLIYRRYSSSRFYMNLLAGKRVEELLNVTPGVAVRDLGAEVGVAPVRKNTAIHD